LKGKKKLRENTEIQKSPNEYSFSLLNGNQSKNQGKNQGGGKEITQGRRGNAFSLFHKGDIVDKQKKLEKKTRERKKEVGIPKKGVTTRVPPSN